MQMRLGEDCHAGDGELLLRFYSFLSDNRLWDASVGPERLEVRLKEFVATINPDTDTEEGLLRRLSGSESAAENAISGARICLWRRHYVQRRWIIQEILNAKSASIHCGEYGIPWKSFEAGPRQMRFVDINLPEADLDICEPSGKIRPGIEVGVILDLPSVDPTLQHLTGEETYEPGPRFVYSQDEEISGERRMLHLLSGASEFQCKKPLDWVYALLGVPGEPLRTPLKPEYGVSPRECFLRLAERMIDVGLAVELIQQAALQPRRLQDPNNVDGGGEEALQLPTWIPDWRQNVRSAVSAQSIGHPTKRPSVLGDGSLSIPSTRIASCCDSCKYAFRLAGERHGTCSGKKEVSLLLPTDTVHKRTEVPMLYPVPDSPGRFFVDWTGCWPFDEHGIPGGGCWSVETKDLSLC
jgi:hypothetical protein